MTTESFKVFIAEPLSALLDTLGNCSCSSCCSSLLRLQVVQDILEHEREFVKELQTVLSCYLRTLQASDKWVQWRPAATGPSVERHSSSQDWILEWNGFYCCGGEKKIVWCTFFFFLSLFLLRLSSTDSATLCGNLEEILTFQQGLCVALEECTKYVTRGINDTSEPRHYGWGLRCGQLAPSC